MQLTTRAHLFVLCSFLVAACGGGNNGGASATTPTPTQARAIRLEAALEFGDVAVGGSSDRTFRIFNEGNSPLTVTGLVGPTGGAYTATWTDGTIPAGSSQTSTIRFSPTEARTYNGTLTVNANHTSGTNTTPISGRGVSPTSAPGPTPNPPAGVTISGTVREEGTNGVIGGATVIVKDTAFASNSDGAGNYAIAGVPNGNYMLRATAGGYQLTERTVSVNGAVSADISMRKLSTPSPSPAPPSPSPAPPPSPACCRVCTTGKACGDTCINRDFTCHTPPGCACNGIAAPAGVTSPVSGFELPFTPVPPAIGRGQEPLRRQQER